MRTDEDALVQPDTGQRRFRSFVARPPETAEAPESHDRHGTEDDIPLLTEVIDAQAARRPDASSLLEALRGEIESEVSSWLVEVLPVAVANASQQILDELDSKARNTLLTRMNSLIETHRAHEANAGEEPPSQ